MNGCKKTTLVRRKADAQWEMVEDRVPINNVKEFDGKPEACLVFALEPRDWTEAATAQKIGVAFRAVHALAAEDQLLTSSLAHSKAMSKRQRQIVQDGAAALEKADFVATAILENDHDMCRSRIPSHKCLVVSDSNLKLALKGMTNTCFVDCGLNGCNLTKDSLLQTLRKKYEQEKPSFVLSYLGKCELNFDECAEYFFLLELFAKAGVGVLHIDSTVNSRWNPHV